MASAFQTAAGGKGAVCCHLPTHPFRVVLRRRQLLSAGREGGGLLASLAGRPALGSLRKPHTPPNHRTQGGQKNKTVLLSSLSGNSQERFSIFPRSRRAAGSLLLHVCRRAPREPTLAASRAGPGNPFLQRGGPGPAGPAPGPGPALTLCPKFPGSPARSERPRRPGSSSTPRSLPPSTLALGPAHLGSDLPRGGHFADQFLGSLLLRFAVRRIVSGPRRRSGGGDSGAGPGGRSSRGARRVVLATGPGHPLRLLRGHSTARRGRRRRSVGALGPSRAQSPAPGRSRHLPLPQPPSQGKSRGGSDALPAAALQAPPPGSGQSRECSGAQGTRTPTRLGPLRTQPRDVTRFLTQNTTCTGREDGSDRGTGATYHFPLAWGPQDGRGGGGGRKPQQPSPASLAVAELPPSAHAQLGQERPLQ